MAIHLVFIVDSGTRLFSTWTSVVVVIRYCTLGAVGSGIFSMFWFSVVPSLTRGLLVSVVVLFL